CKFHQCFPLYIKRIGECYNSRSEKFVNPVAADHILFIGSSGEQQHSNDKYHRQKNGQCKWMRPFSMYAERDLVHHNCQNNGRDTYKNIHRIHSTLRLNNSPIKHDATITSIVPKRTMKSKTKPLSAKISKYTISPIKAGIKKKG